MGRVTPIDHYKLKQRRAPRSRQATCDEVECWGYVNGFELHIDEATELGKRQAHYLRGDRSRTKPVEHRVGTLTVFAYPPGQRCTAPDSPEHWVAVDQFFIARGQHVRPVEWVERFEENQGLIAERIARG
jgi:hypothetical protein